MHARRVLSIICAWFLFHVNHILQLRGMLVMVSMLASSAVDRGFDPWSGPIKDYIIVICCFSSKPTPQNLLYETLRQKRWFQVSLVNFPFICSNIPAAPAYRVYIPQMIRYSRACSTNHEFLYRGCCWEGSYWTKDSYWLSWKFYGHHPDLVDRYGISVSQRIMDMFCSS